MCILVSALLFHFISMLHTYFNHNPYKHCLKFTKRLIAPGEITFNEETSVFDIFKLYFMFLY